MEQEEEKRGLEYEQVRVRTDEGSKVIKGRVNAMMHHQTIKDKQQRRWRRRLEKLGGELALGWTWRRGV